MKRTLATNAIEGVIPHKVGTVSGIEFFMPVKLEKRLKLNGNEAIDMMIDRRTSEYLPVPKRTESGYVYAWPGGGDYV